MNLKSKIKSELEREFKEIKNRKIPYQLKGCVFNILDFIDREFPNIDESKLDSYVYEDDKSKDEIYMTYNRKKGRGVSIVCTLKHFHTHTSWEQEKYCDVAIYSTWDGINDKVSFDIGHPEFFYEDFFFPILEKTLARLIGA